MPRKYQRPKFLNEIISQELYEKWLQRKSQAHYRRDKKRGNTTASGAEYKMAIHEAVKECGGKETLNPWADYERIRDYYRSLFLMKVKLKYGWSFTGSGNRKSLFII